MTDENKRVLVLSKAREGKVYDKRQLDEEKLVEFVLFGSNNSCRFRLSGITERICEHQNTDEKAKKERINIQRETIKHRKK